MKAVKRIRSPRSAAGDQKPMRQPRNTRANSTPMRPTPQPTPRRRVTSKIKRGPK